MPYLTMHAAFVKCVDTMGGMVVMHHSLDPNHGPFFFTKHAWEEGGKLSRPRAVSKLFRDDPRLPPLLKLTGETRGYAEQMLCYIPIHPNSFVRRTLHLSNTRRLARSSASVIALVLITVLIAHGLKNGRNEPASARPDQVAPRRVGLQ